jgi:hypothetical protein
VRKLSLHVRPFLGVTSRGAMQARGDVDLEERLAAWSEPTESTTPISPLTPVWPMWTWLPTWSTDWSMPSRRFHAGHPAKVEHRCCDLLIAGRAAQQPS